MSETTFRRNETNHNWYWHTQAANGDLLADSGEGYVTLSGAINGFLSQQGFSDWKPGEPLPQGFSQTRVSQNEYIIERIEA